MLDTSSPPLTLTVPSTSLKLSIALESGLVIMMHMAVNRVGSSLVPSPYLHARETFLARADTGWVRDYVGSWLVNVSDSENSTTAHARMRPT